MNNVLRKATASILLLVLLMTASACRSTEIIVEKNEEAGLDEKFCSLLLQEKKEVVTALGLSDSQVKKYDSASFHYLVNDYQEEIEGEYNFAGNCDLAHFARCIDECGLKMILRVGPWCHGEVRNGGFPDWLLKKDFECRKRHATLPHP